MKAEQTVKMKQNLSGTYDVTVEDKNGRIKTIHNLTFERAIKTIGMELNEGAVDEKRDKL